MIINYTPVAHFMRNSCWLSRVEARSTGLYTSPLLLQVVLSTLNTLLLTWSWETHMKMNAMPSHCLTHKLWPKYMYIHGYTWISLKVLFIPGFHIISFFLFLLWNDCKHCTYLTKRLTCTSPTRGMAWAACHLFQMEKGSIGALRNTSHPRQTIIKSPNWITTFSFKSKFKCKWKFNCFTYL